MFPDRPAVEVGGARLSYGQMRARAAALAATLQRHSPPGGPALTAVLAYRSVTAFAGVLAALLQGHGYVPLNRTFPTDRTKTMLTRAGCRAVIVDSESEHQLERVLEGAHDRLLLILPERDNVEALARRWPQHSILGADDLEPPNQWVPNSVSPDAIAYLLFTSGSTGIPKGVMVAQRNVAHFVDVAVERYGITETDRFSQTFDMTFDLSAFDMFVAWERGACVCCPEARILMNPARFIQESQLSVWFSVPSTGVIMKRLGLLKPNRYPTLRWSLFCGEPLPEDVATAWQAAAPGSIVENLYGPTELTIACSVYRWDPQCSPQECRFGIVPIGQPLPEMEALVVDENLAEVQSGGEGELIMAGPQVTLGYWQDPEKTASGFVVPPGQSSVYYRTGDRVQKPIGGGPLLYKGRMDHQVKVRGFRVELGEVESFLRSEAGVEAAVALAWPVTSSGAEGIVAFLCDSGMEPEMIREKLKVKLPGYAVPREIYFLPELPLNSNGKVDRKALQELLCKQKL